MIDEIRAFVLFAQEGSIQKVAQRIPLTQPAVTRQIQRLEQIVGAELLDRRQKPPVLTPAGHQVLASCRKILDDLDGLKAFGRDAEPEGIIRIGLSHGLSDERCANALAMALAGFPRVSPHLVTAWSGDLIERFRQGQLDAAIVSAATPRALDGELIGRDRLVVIGAQAAKLPKTTEEIRLVPWVLSHQPCDARRALTEMIGPPNIVAEVQDAGLQLSWVRRGHGFGLTPLRLLDHGRPKGIKIVHELDLKLGTEIIVLRSPHLHGLGKAVDAIADALRREVAIDRA